MDQTSPKKIKGCLTQKLDLSDYEAGRIKSEEIAKVSQNRKKFAKLSQNQKKFADLNSTGKPLSVADIMKAYGKSVQKDEPAEASTGHPKSPTMVILSVW